MKYIVVALCIMFGISIGNAVVVEVPPAWGNQDIVVTGPTRVQADEFTLFSFIQLINTYLWFFMGALAFAALIYAGVRLISAQGNPDQIAATHKLLLGIIGGIVVIIFSYALVRLIINLL